MFQLCVPCDLDDIGRYGPNKHPRHADAIDISGFTLADGTRLNLLSDWNGAADKAAFHRRANRTACTWFRVTLGPA